MTFNDLMAGIACQMNLLYTFIGSIIVRDHEEFTDYRIGSSDKTTGNGGTTLTRMGMFSLFIVVLWVAWTNGWTRRNILRPISKRNYELIIEILQKVLFTFNLSQLAKLAKPDIPMNTLSRTQSIMCHCLIDWWFTWMDLSLITGAIFKRMFYSDTNFNKIIFRCLINDSLHCNSSIIMRWLWCHTDNIIHKYFNARLNWMRSFSFRTGYGRRSHLTTFLYFSSTWYTWAKDDVLLYQDCGCFVIVYDVIGSITTRLYIIPCCLNSRAKCKIVTGSTSKIQIFCNGSTGLIVWLLLC